MLKKVRTHNDDQKTGVEIVRKALQAPARQIATNAGEDGSVIVGKILENSHYGFGFDAQSGEYVDMVKKGIIDPTKVVRQASAGRFLGRRLCSSPPRRWWPNCRRRRTACRQCRPVAAGWTSKRSSSKAATCCLK